MILSRFRSYRARPVLKGGGITTVSAAVQAVYRDFSPVVEGGLLGMPLVDPVGDVSLARPGAWAEAPAFSWSPT
jgi:hypothetical protein